MDWLFLQQESPLGRAPLANEDSLPFKSLGNPGISFVLLPAKAVTELVCLQVGPCPFLLGKTSFLTKALGCCRRSQPHWLLQPWCPGIREAGSFYISFSGNLHVSVWASVCVAVCVSFWISQCLSLQPSDSLCTSLSQRESRGPAVDVSISPPGLRSLDLEGHGDRGLEVLDSHVCLLFQLWAAAPCH